MSQGARAAVSGA